MANTTSPVRSAPAPTATTPAVTKSKQVKTTVHLDKESYLLVCALQKRQAAKDEFGVAHPRSEFVRQAVKEYAKARSVKPLREADVLAEAEEAAQGEE